LQQIATQQVAVLQGRNRVYPDHSTVTMMGIFALREEPDYRNFAALDFVCSELNARISPSTGRCWGSLQPSALTETREDGFEPVYGVGKVR
jgi:hypothetical protein